MKLCGALCNLIQSVQFKKRERNPWRSATFSMLAGLSKWDQIAQSVSIIINYSSVRKLAILRLSPKF